MSLLDKLESKFGRFYIPNLTKLLVFGQSVFFILSMLGVINLGDVVFVPALALQGQIWRLLAFPFMPPLTDPLFFIFAMLLLYQMGTALEGTWGEFKFNLFILIGYVLTVAAAFLSPFSLATNAFIGGSIFLAFAFLYPDFELLLFFILPVKVKWLALLMWIGYALGMVSGPWSVRLGILASLGNYLIFFGPELAWRLKRGGMRTASQARSSARRRGEEPMHRCVQCGRTDQTNPEMLFRYCTTCAGSPAYCEEHFKDHEHIKG